MKRLITTPFGLAVAALLVLAGWAVWTAGVFDGAVARQVRSSSVYIAPSVELDQAAAERVIGNRRLVVAFLEPDADPGEECDDVGNAADDTLVLFLQVVDGEFDQYGCAQFPGGDDENFGKAFVAETQIASGADQFAADPLTALKVIVVNYDGLVKAGMIPDGSRTIDPSLPRYLIAGGAVFAVLAGAGTLYVAGRRFGRLAATRQDEATSVEDERGALHARVAVLAKYVIELDERYPEADRNFQRKYRTLAADYAKLVADVTGAGKDKTGHAKVAMLTRRARALANGKKRNR